MPASSIFLFRNYTYRISGGCGIESTWKRKEERFHHYLPMTDPSSEEAIEGLKSRIMKIVTDYQGNFSEIEVLKQIMCESELLLATYNVR